MEVIVIALVIGTFLLFSLLVMANSLWFYTKAPKLQAADASFLNLPPPPAIQPIVAALNELGFKRLGETGDLIAVTHHHQVRIWLFIDPNATTCAAVFADGTQGHAIVYSWFGDEAVVVTAYPSGTSINDPDFRYHTISTSMGNAYRYHLEQVVEFKLRHGSPNRLNNMSEIIRLDTLYNAKFARRRLRPALLRGAGSPILILYMLLVLTSLLMAMYRLHLPSHIIMISMAVLILPVTIWLLRSRRT
jgi:hypothetical protein